MRRAIDRLFTPAFEAVVRRFDPAIGFDDHVAFLSRLPARPALPDRTLDAVAGHSLVTALEALGVARRGGVTPPLPDSRFKATWDAETMPGDDAPDLLCLDLAVGMLTETRIHGDAARLESTAAGSFDWLDGPRAASAAAWACLAAAHDDSIEAGLRDRALCALTAGFEPRQWFIAKRGVIHGTSALLRALVLHVRSGHAEDALRDYVCEVLERLLKHVEVRRDDALRLADGAGADASQALERIRFTVALLEGSTTFGDLRLLNSALKRNDLHLTVLTTRSRTRDAGWWVELAAYTNCLARQERLFAEAFPS